MHMYVCMYICTLPVVDDVSFRANSLFPSYMHHYIHTYIYIRRHTYMQIYVPLKHYSRGSRFCMERLEVVVEVFELGPQVLV